MIYDDLWIIVYGYLWIFMDIYGYLWIFDIFMVAVWMLMEMD